jgi:hypothetical protein
LYEYEHTQPGTLVRFLVGVLAIAFGSAAVAVPMFGGEASAAAAYGFAAAIMGGILVLFHSLTVRVSANDIVLAFGIGLVRKSFVVNDIQSAAVVRNRWYHGWGIKKIRGGWLYNVSGFDAVEIQLENGRTSRIGTDEPDRLHAAIESLIDASG